MAQQQQQREEEELNNFFLEGDRLRLDADGSRAQMIYFNTGGDGAYARRFNEAHARFEAWCAERDEIVDAMPMLALLELFKAAIIARKRTVWPEYKHVIHARLQSIRMYCYPATPHEGAAAESELELYTMINDLDQYIAFYSIAENREHFMRPVISTRFTEEVQAQQREANLSLDGVIAQREILNAKIVRMREARAIALLVRREPFTGQLHGSLGGNDDVMAQVARLSLVPAASEPRPPPHYRLPNDHFLL